MDIAEARTAASRALFRAIPTYVDGGTEREKTLAANWAAFDRRGLYPSIAGDATEPALRRGVLGHDRAVPLPFGPAEMLGLIGNGGEIAAAKAAGYDGLRLIVDNPVHGDRSVERRQGSAHTSDAGLSMADIVKAIALGATACSTVRSFCYGLAAAGEDGIRHVFALFRSEMLRTLRFMGCRSLDDLGPDRLRRLP